MAEPVAVARDKASLAAVNLEQRPKAIVFHLEKPIGVIEGLGQAYKQVAALAARLAKKS
jgi:hypothetical protein